MKKFFTTLHRGLALMFGLIIGLSCLTGALLVFEDELLEKCYPERYFTEKTAHQPLTPEMIVSKVKAQWCDTVHVTGLKLYHEADRTWVVSLRGHKNDIFVDPYTGIIKGEDEQSTFFRKTLSLHRRLMYEVSKGERPWGKWVVGTATLAFVFILLSGLIAWLPKNWKMLKQRLQVKRGKGAFRFWYDLHLAGGFYAAVFLLIMALTGLTWSFPWYRTPFYTLFGAEPAELAKPRKKTAPAEEFKPIDYRGWDKVAGHMMQLYPYFNTIKLQEGCVTVESTDYGNVRAHDKYHFDPISGSVTQVILNRDRTEYSRLRNWVYCIHTGKWGGLTTKILYCISTLLGLICCLTGYGFWWRKWRKRRKQ